MSTKTIAVLRSNPKDAALPRLIDSLSKIAIIECFLWDRQRDFQPISENERIHYHKCGIRAGFYNLATLVKLGLFQCWLLGKLLFTKCEVIHAIDLDTGVPGYLAAKLKCKKFVYHCLDPYYAILPDRWPRFLAQMTQKIENWLISRADLFIITDLLRIAQHEGATPRKIVEIPNVPVPSSTISSHQNPDHTFTVGYLGSLIEGRNLPTIIESCGELGEDGISLTIGGFGPLEKEIEEHAARWENVNFLPWLPYYELLQEEATFDLFLHMTDPANESQRWVSPNKLFEAMFFGKPIIVSKQTLAAKRVEAFGNGMTVNYGAKSELKDAILDLKGNSGWAKVMGEKGKKEFEKNWRPDLIEKKLLNTYEGILKKTE